MTWGVCCEALLGSDCCDGVVDFWGRERVSILFC